MTLQSGWWIALAVLVVVALVVPVVGWSAMEAGSCSYWTGA
jgi:hypothetical protein